MIAAVNPDLIRYIRDNRPIYTREAIRRRLIEAGHAEADVDAAWAAVEADAPPPPTPVGPPPAAPPADPAGAPSDALFTPDQFRAPAAGAPIGDAAAVQTPPASQGRPRFPVLNSPLFWVTLVGYILGMYIVAPLIGGALADLDDSGVVGGLLWLILWLGGLVAGVVLRRRNEPVALGLLLGFVLVVGLPIALGFIAIVIIAGICLVSLVPGV
jgi:hypothetical protein